MAISRSRSNEQIRVPPLTALLGRSVRSGLLTVFRRVRPPAEEPLSVPELPLSSIPNSSQADALLHDLHGRPAPEPPPTASALDIVRFGSGDERRQLLERLGGSCHFPAGPILTTATADPDYLIQERAVEVFNTLQSRAFSCLVADDPNEEGETLLQVAAENVLPPPLQASLVQRAILALRQAIQIDGWTDSRACGLIRGYLTLGRPEEAAITSQAALIQLSTPSSELVLVCLDALWRSGRRAEARNLCASISTDSPNTPPLLAEIARRFRGGDDG